MLSSSDTESVDDPSEAPPRLALREVSKRFGGVQAIKHADFVLLPGEVHALIGENGAGKSTLIKMISGAETPDTGTMEMNGRPVDFGTASDSIDLGIATVYQETQLFKQLTVAENIFLGRELKRGPRIDWAAQNSEVVALLARLGLPADYAIKQIGELSAAEAQQVAIAKALSGHAQVLILDEPSAILTNAEIQVLFTAIRRLVEQNVSIIYISHRLDELAQICDRVTVMRDGETLGTYPIGELSVQQMAEMMVGGQFEEGDNCYQGACREEISLAYRQASSGRAFHNVNLDVHAGEVVVLYGLVGSGVQAIAQAAYGMTPLTEGSMTLLGKPYRPGSARHAQKAGLAMLPADRKREGMLSFQSIKFNIAVAHLKLLSKAGIWMQPKRELATANEMIDRLAIKTPSAEQPLSAMSGGNAQKVVLARQLVERPPILVLAEPTQGVDIGAKEEIHRIVAELAAQGTAILVATSDLTEAMRISDRLIVVREGAVFAEFGRGADQAAVLAAASGQLGEEQQAELVQEQL